MKIKEDFEVESFVGSDVGLAFPLKLIDFQKMPAITVPQECVGTNVAGVSQGYLSEMAKTGVWTLIQTTPNVPEGLQAQIQTANSVIQQPELLLRDPARVVLGGAEGELEFTQKRWQLRSSNQKVSVLREIEEFLRQVPKLGAVRNNIFMITDELLTNALFNAPFEDPEYTLDRNMLVVLDPDMSAEFIVAYNSDRMFVGCFDSFGTFDCQTLLDRIGRYSSDGLTSLNMGMGGAGIGLMRVIYLSSELYVVVEEGKRTLVGCSLPLGGSVKKVITTPKSFFFQSFKSFDSQGSGCRIEKRDRHILVRMSGKLEIIGPSNYVDIFSAQEVTLDLRLLTSVTDEALSQLMALFEGAAELKRVNLDYVPCNLVDSFFKLEKINPLVEVRSIWASLRCEACKTQQEVIIKKGAGTSAAVGKKTGVVKCQGCGHEI